ncbi:5-oxopent-3-ene-1,2,5-tricarboxylate decarboxylase [Sneathiella chungangensis]|uniref:5-oxopent-3-ene-1,2,5-tricarboxylate decarboxylase n=1 Tax=Sneathiella chungangensis TaxID=1418234 RepID=A0A845MGQ1_9PROT|nr:fumarylacetoacetate hydrolase family protein [Sneathiella chungangensis]MZR23203.1 5-oxopent-3-ene-1,2,5-tricarboxylate decarboxylase [Sneathiella chungangensis]
MRLASFLHDGEIKLGLLKADGIVDIRSQIPGLPASIKEILRQDKLSEIRKSLGDLEDSEAIRIEDVTFLPPISDAEKIICIGRNYAAHAKEGGAETPSYPEIFLRTNRSILGHDQPIIRPKCSDKLDYEGELVVVIGKTARHVTEKDALDYVAGYSIFNEATLRDYQRKSTQWTIGKNFDKTGGFGPCLVTPEKLPPGATGLSIKTFLNCNLMQDGNTGDLVFPIAKLIALLSECMTLVPGDVIVTGTPSGVGYARNPPVWMKPGDICQVSIEGIGTLSNPIEDE